MATHRRFSKYIQLPQNAPASAEAPAEVPAEAPSQPPVETGPERSILFGMPDNQKSIAILAGAGFLLIGLVYFALYRSDPGFSYMALFFIALHGGLLGMLLGQLILVYPDRVMVICTLIAVLVGVVIYVMATGMLDGGYRFGRRDFQAVLAIFFWAGFIGFWLGFVAYYRRVAERRRFQRRFKSPE